MGLQDIVSVLETYRGREKSMRTLQYGLLFITPLANENVRAALQTLSSQLGTTRVILRLFDDLPMLQYSLSCVKENKDKDALVRCLEVVGTVADQLYFPVEHLAWARDMKMLKGSSASLWHASLLLWGFSLILTISRSLRLIFLMKNRAKRATVEEKHKIDAMYRAELLTVIMQAADLLNALNWMPRRPWTKPFPVWQVGFLGLVSSLIGFSKFLSVQSL